MQKLAWKKKQMSKLYRWIASLALSVHIISLPAQPGWRATVLDAQSQSPLTGVSVAWLHAKDSSLVQGGLTDAKGRVALPLAPDTTHLLRLSRLGYQTRYLRATEAAPPSPLLLEPLPHALEAVSIRGRRSAVEMGLGKQVLRPQLDPSQAGNSVAEALAQLPAVQTDLEGNLQVRGSAAIAIWINGQPTQRDSRSLRSIPASALQKIEVITNPSAKYDAQGLTVINLVFRPETEQPWRVAPRLDATYPYRLMGSLDAQWQGKRFSSYLNASLRYSRYQNRQIQQRENQRGALTGYRTEVLTQAQGLTPRFSTGLNYQPDSNLSLGVEVNYHRWRDQGIEQQESFFRYRDERQLTVQPRHRTVEVEDEWSLALQGEKNWGEGQSLTLRLSTQGETERNLSAYNLDGLDLQGTPLAQSVRRSDEGEGQRHHEGRLDYSLPLGKWGTLEVGLKGERLRYTLDQQLDFLSDTLFLPRNRFRIGLTQGAAYVSQEKKWKRWELRLGLRYEYLLISSQSQTLDSSARQRASNFFPNLQLLYRPGEIHIWGLSYARRIVRPGFFDLNPFLSFTDPLALRRGNPYLRPALADQFELTYQARLAAWQLFLTGYYRATHETVQSVIEPLDGERILITYTNLGQRRRYGLEGNLRYSPRSWLDLSASFTLNQSQFISRPGEVEAQFPVLLAWGADIQGQLRWGQGWACQVSGDYNGPSYGVQTRYLPRYSLDLGLRKTFAQERGAVFLKLSDVFNTELFSDERRGSNFVLYHAYKYQTQRITLGVNYRWGRDDQDR